MMVDHILSGDIYNSFEVIMKINAGLLHNWETKFINNCILSRHKNKIKNEQCLVLRDEEEKEIYKRTVKTKDE